MQLVDAKRGIQPNTMPFMSLASTAIDTVSPDPITAQSTCMSFLPTDSALFWVTEDKYLLEKQKTAQKPIIQWIEETLGLKLLIAEGMTVRLNHPPESVEKIRCLVLSLVR
jgi:chaperone required for assembly of F1-ATPase